VRNIKGFDALQKFYDRPPATLERLSLNARFRARIKFTRTAADDQFDLLEVLSVPPFVMLFTIFCI
jgi:hypothetical protein